tara:strand:- start:52 stop:546 length:495 start_codon:yes stop_codon:yes gene_type:complete
MPNIYSGKPRDYKGNDDFYTQNSTWDLINSFIPKDKIIYEGFYGDGNSGNYLTELGCKQVIHKNIDFFENVDLINYDILISNIPFSIKKDILNKLYEVNKPFIIIMPYEVIFYKYFDKYKTTDTQLIIPKQRLNFLQNGKIKKFNYDCVFFCWKMNFKNAINYV